MKITILGPGSWGLTVAWLISEKVKDTYVWGLPQFIQPMKENRMVEKPVKVKIPENIILTSNLQEAAVDADIILFVVPSDAIRSVARQLKDLNLNSKAVLVSLAKGLELTTLFRMSEILKQELPGNEVASLSGPTLALEILEGKPTAAVVASENLEVASYIQQSLNRDDIFRLYTNRDIIGVELGGSLKNVIAIATGFAYSLNLGHNAIGAMITRGLAEIVRMSVLMGANPSTLYGLSGIGDLIATCNSPTSRNYRVGYAIGQGKTIDEILANLGAVAEGVKTTEAVVDLASKFNIEMPISQEVKKLIRSEVTPQGAIMNMMRRQLKSEDYYSLAS